jgi:heme-degrading monooxygenase HmoA
MSATLALPLLAALSATPGALPAPEASPVVAMVRVPKPWYAPRALIVRRMRDTQAQYAALSGLRFKAYSFERASGDFGGVYLWQDRAAAEAWFNTAWFERVRRERGVEGQVLLLDAPVTVDTAPGGPAADADSPSVTTWVSLPIPPGVTRAQLVAGFQAAVPEYQRVPGLLRKHFVIEADGRFGGVYLWRDEAAARAWFSDSWRQRALKAYGAQPTLTWFDTPILLPVQPAPTP